MNSRELYHHGVLGQKWGKKNGPPYPLGASDHSASERKAGWRKSLDKSSAKSDNKSRKNGSVSERKSLDKSSAKSDNKGRKDGSVSERKSLDKSPAKSDNKGRKSVPEESNSEGDSKDSTEKKHKLTDKQKKAIIIGAAAVATVIAAYGAYKFVDSGHFRQMVEKGKSLINGTDSSEFKKNDIYKRDMGIDEIQEEIVTRINRDNRYRGFGYNRGFSGKNNCKRCTYAYELSRRGYEVQATATLHGTGQTTEGATRALGKKPFTTSRIIGAAAEIQKRYPEKTAEEGQEMLLRLTRQKMSANKIPLSSSDDGVTKAKQIMETISKMPNRSRGELAMTWNTGQRGGHSVAWEVIDGYPYIMDCQTGKVFKSAKEFSSYAQFIKSANYTRLDNKKLDMNFLHRWVKDDYLYEREHIYRPSELSDKDRYRNASSHPLAVIR